MPLNAPALPQLRRRSSSGALAALLVPLLSIAFSGCSDLFEYHAYDARVTGETGINKKNIGLIEERLHARDTFRFAVISDTQGWYDETEEFVVLLLLSSVFPYSHLNISAQNKYILLNLLFSLRCRDFIRVRHFFNKFQDYFETHSFISSLIID